jgi:hypothetical protein
LVLLPFKDTDIWPFGTHLSGTTVGKGEDVVLDSFTTFLSERKSGKNRRE